MHLQRDLDAAHALVELANEVSCFPKNDLRSYGVNGMPAIKVFLAKLDNDEVCHDNHSWVCEKKAMKHFRKFQKSVVEDQMKGETGERLQFSLSEAAYPSVRKQKKRKFQKDFSLPESNNMNGYVSEEDDNLYETYGFLDGHGLSIRLGNKGRRHIEACLSGGRHRLGMLFLLCNQVTKKQKGNADMSCMEGSNESDYLHSRSKKLIDEPSTPLNEEGLQTANGTGSLAGVASDPPLSERKSMDDVVLETIESKKQSFTLITPTIHTGFSFSIIHLLSAIRTAMVSPHAEDALVFGKHFVKSNPEGVHLFHSHGINGMNDNSEHREQKNSEQTEQKNLPSLTIHEIVQRVQSNPGDPCILETKEPLQDLVRGALKIFSSKTAPLGAKGWKALTLYEKSSKSWYWIGPVSFNSPNHDFVEEEVSSEAWGLPHKLLVKLVDCFANWLKNDQEALQQIGGLPAPPATLMEPTHNVEERFRNLRNQKSIATISPSSEEVRAYFRREEVLRYLVPDRAFSYTAADGRKSTVSPLRCNGNPSSKCRDHFMLKPDRPPHINLLCLVRDAAARLPGSIGTRADVCTLMRDSQYVVEDVSDIQINQVVSGALDRLHYEFDPCVQFNGERKLWVYLHGEREEDDFQDGGTSSTIKWKWNRKHAREKSSEEQ
ncbi:hypothetical protein L1049_007826 [Liquidambar formosana]|uniref:Nuclear factor related to kappa-B-binding protein second winged helix domain-containing protein n=1 Tax=Liquidambar formosana TaxID=63359 RepID=A0AAP0S2J3_LIQFO